MLTTNIFYQTDLSLVNKLFTPSQAANSLTLGELLIGFFYFYTTYYDPDYHVITSSHPTVSLLPLSQYLEELKKEFGKINFLKDTFIKDVSNRKWSFMLVDPFDKTYNPAKLVPSHSSLEDRVFRAMEESLDYLIQHGELMLEMEDDRHNDKKKRRRSNKQGKS